MLTPNILQMIEGTVPQGVREKISYRFLSTPWGPTPINVAPVVIDITADETDVTEETMPTGVATVSGDWITLPQLQNLEAAHLYRVYIVFETGGQTVAPSFPVLAES